MKYIIFRTIKQLAQIRIDISCLSSSGVKASFSLAEDGKYMETSMKYMYLL